MAHVADSVNRLDRFVRDWSQRLQSELDTLSLRHDVLREALLPLQFLALHRPSLATYASHRPQWKPNVNQALEESKRSTQIEAQLRAELIHLDCLRQRVKVVRRISNDQARQLSHLTSESEPLDNVDVHRSFAVVLDELNSAMDLCTHGKSFVATIDDIYPKLAQRIRPLLLTLDLHYLALIDKTSLHQAQSHDRSAATTAQVAAASIDDVSWEQQTIESLLRDIENLEAARDALQRNAEDAIRNLEDEFQTHITTLRRWKEQQIADVECSDGDHDQQLLARIEALQKELAAQEEDRMRRFEKHPLQGRLRTLQQISLVPTLSRLSCANTERRRRSASSGPADDSFVADVNDPVAREWMRDGDDAILVLQDLDSGSYVAVQRDHGHLRCCPLAQLFSSEDGKSIQIRVSFVP